MTRAMSSEAAMLSLEAHDLFLFPPFMQGTAEDREVTLASRGGSRGVNS